MKQGKGFSVYAGAAVGKAYLFRRSCTAAAASGDAKREQAAFEAACKTADEQLGQLAEKTRAELGEEQGMILEVQQMMLQDPDLLENISGRIAKGAGAAVAVQAAGEECSAEFAALEDAYMKARAADIRDITRRLTAILNGGGTAFTMEQPGIVVADDLGPSETIQLPRDKILAFVTKQGSANSHTAILARILNIPSLVQADIELDEALDGKTMAVDGFAGRWYIEPDAATLAELETKQQAQASQRQTLERWRGKPSVTQTGRAVRLYGNIGCAEDAKTAMENDAEGIGLMRSEFLYLGRETCPTEEELYTAYRAVLETMQGRPVVIRTLDIGADKQVEYFGLEKEENPALGKRGIRICFEKENVFRDEMRAIYRAAAAGPVSVMFPMIASAWEVEKAKAFCAGIEAELAAQNIPHGKPELGIMIETPAAAVCSEELAKLVDFFSVGTNDLTQYTLAADRQNAGIAPYCNPHHPAVLALLAYIAQSAKKAGIWAGICGELAADPELTDTFLKMGYDELSVSPGRILGLRKRICESEV